MFKRIAVLSLFALPLLATPGGEAVDRINRADTVLREIMDAPDQGIPQDLLNKAYCAVLVPGFKRGGFIVGGHYGKGVVLCRQADGQGWTGPSTVRLEGGSFGLQIGGSETDIVMLVMNQGGAEKLMKSEFTLGGEAAVAAGPLGRSTNAQTDAMMHAQILSWSRSRGVFAGAVLSGGTLRPDDDDNAAVYGKAVTHKSILNGEVVPPESADGLRTTLSKYSSREAR
jgi:lipid-binding SYLF domain-containing protein